MSLLTRVKAGAAFLDAKYGKKWRKKIDLDSLDLGVTDRCVLGQTDEDYDNHSAALGLNDDSAANLGFTYFDDELTFHDDAEKKSFYEKLTATWKRYLAKGEDK